MPPFEGLHARLASVRSRVIQEVQSREADTHDRLADLEALILAKDAVRLRLMIFLNTIFFRCLEKAYPRREH